VICAPHRDGKSPNQCDAGSSLPRFSNEGGGYGRPGSTPFLIAAANADVDTMRLLLGHRADPSLRDHQNTSAVMLASSGSKFESRTATHLARVTQHPEAGLRVLRADRVLPSSALLDWSDHIRLYLLGPERPVVHPDVVDHPVEVLAPNATAADHQPTA